jgi:hypothetical protein
MSVAVLKIITTRARSAAFAKSCSDMVARPWNVGDLAFKYESGHSFPSA